MSAAVVVPVELAARRARLAVGALFLTNGALYANILPRYPEIKARLALDNATYGLAVVAFAFGAILAGLAAAHVLRRFGSGTTAVLGTIVTSLGLLGAGAAPGVWGFAGFLLLAGAADAITDVGQNAHGLRVQRRYGRSIINSFHALWSIGAVLGGLMAAGAIALQVSVGIHLTVSAALFCAVSLGAWRLCLPGPDAHEADVAEADVLADVAPSTRRRGVRVGWVLLALVGIGMGCALVEDAGFTWASLYLTSLSAPGAVAALGLISLMAAQFVGRLLGDRMVDAFGQRAVVRAGGAIVLLGMGLALAFPSVPGTIVGFAAAGFGVATLVPAAMSEADALPGLRPGTGLTIVSWLMRVGYLVSPPVVGVVADAHGLRVGLLVLPLAGLLVVCLAGVLPKRKAAGVAEVKG